MRKPSMDTRGALMLIVWAAILGLNQVLVKIVNAGIAPVFQAGVRSGCGFVLVVGFALLMRRTLSIAEGSLIPGLIAGVFFSLEFMLIFQAIDFTSVSRASVLFYTMPVWVAVGAHFLIPGERLSPTRLLGLTLAVVGVAVAMIKNDAPATEYALLGDMMCLVAAIFWAAIALLTRTTGFGNASPEMQLLYQLAVSGVLLIAVAPLFGPPLRELTLHIVGLFSLQVVFVVFVGFLGWFWILSIYPASDVASFSFLVPVFAVILSAMILNEAITTNLMVALVLVTAGIFLINRRGNER